MEELQSQHHGIRAPIAARAPAFRKATAKLKKHGVSFAEATTQLGDTLSITSPDVDHYDREARFLTIGVSNRGRLVVVAGFTQTLGARPQASIWSLKAEHESEDEAVGID